MNRIPKIIKSVFAGGVLSILTAAATLGASELGASFVATAFLWFGMPSAYLFHLILPTGVVYQLFPEGGGPAFVALLMVGSIFQLLVIYSIGFYFIWFSRHAR